MEIVTPATAPAFRSAPANPLGRHSAFLPELDGLRAVSVLLVVISHLGFGHIVPGGLGVTVFFFISGFIISRLLLGEIAQTGTLSFSRFYARRFVRLSPALIGYVICAVVFISSIGWQFSAAEIASIVFYVENYYHIYVGYTKVGTTLSPFGILWSLAVEEHFYVLFPAVLFIYSKRLGSLFQHLIMLIIVVLAWRLWLAYGVGVQNLEYDRIFKSTDTRLDSIAYGCVTALALERYGKKFVDWCANPAIVIASIAMLLVSLVIRDEHFRESFRYSMQGLSMISIVITLVYSSRLRVVAAVLRTSPSLYIGRLSYSLYLYHWLAVGVADHFYPTGNRLEWLLVSVGITVIGTLASYHLVEVPTLRLRRRFQVPAAAGA